MPLDSQFKRIQEKLQQLVKQQVRLKKENEHLKQELEESRQKERANLQRIEELGHQIAILKMSAGTMSEKDKKDFEKMINQYLKEIDNCIAYLSR